MIGDLPESSKIGVLVNKLIERQKELEAQQANLEKIYKDEQANVSARVAALEGLLDIGKEEHEAFGRPDNQKGTRRPE